MKSQQQAISFLGSTIDKWLLPAIILFAGILRLFRMEYTGLWADEIGQVQIAENTLIQTILQSVSHAASTPLDYVITHFALYVGRSEGILQMPAVIFGVLAVFVIYKIGQQMFDEKTGILASFLLAILPIHVYYSREVRFYSLATLFALLSLYFFIKAIERNTRRDWIIFGVIQFLGLYSHYYLLAITAIEGIWLLLEVVFRKLDRKVFTRFLVSAGTAVITFIPWIAYDYQYERVKGKNVFNTGIGLDFFLPNRTTFLTANLFYHPRYFGNSKWWIAFCMISIVVGLVLAIWYRKANHKFFSRILLLFWLYLGGIAFIFCMDALATYFFASRQVLIFTPYLILIIAASVVSVINLIYSRRIHLKSVNAQNWLTNGTLLGIAIFGIWSLGPGLLSVYSTDIADWRIHRQGLRETGQYLTANVKYDDILMTTHPTQISFYAGDIGPRITWLPDDPAAIREQAQMHDRVWLFTTGTQIKLYPKFYKFIQQEGPLEISLQGSLLLYVYSANKSSSEILLELLKSKSIPPPTMILTDVINRAISANLQDDMYTVITDALNQKGLEAVNKASIAAIGGEAFLKSGDLEKASRLLQQAVELDPRNARNWTVLGQFYSQSGNLEQAVSAYKKSIAIKPDDYWSNYLLAYRLRQLDQMQEALLYAEKALPLAPTNNNHADALNQIALINENLGNKEQACSNYSESYRMREDQVILAEMEKLSCSLMR